MFFQNNVFNFTQVYQTHDIPFLFFTVNQILLLQKNKTCTFE